MPVLGICRGMQLINVACGGTLVQHLPERYGHHEHRRVVGSFDGADHDVLLSEGSLAARAAGELLHATKSHHHQGVDRVGEGLVVSGVSTLDELPEAIEWEGEPSDRRFVLGVQWHPEADLASSVVGALVEAAGARVPTSTRHVRAGARTSPRRRESAGGAPYTARPVRLSRAIRATAWGMVVAGVAAPLVRKRVSAPPLIVQAVAFGAPLGLCVAVRRSRTRDVAVCVLQMWAYLAEYKSPHDDEQAQRRRVHVSYPILADRVLGFGELPTVRLQRALAPGGVRGPTGRRSIACSCGRTGAGSPSRTVPSRASSCAIVHASPVQPCSPTRCSTSAPACTGSCPPRRRGMPLRRTPHRPRRGRWTSTQCPCDG